MSWRHDRSRPGPSRMTRRDFELLARTIRTARSIGPGNRQLFAHELARALHQHCPNFDAGRFIDAATQEPT